MKKIKLILAGWLLFNSNVFAQPNPGVNELALLAKTWGFLKYYHPEIAAGGHNWDSVLIVSLDRLLASAKKTSLAGEIDRLLFIAGADTAPEYLPLQKDPHCFSNYDISWISDNKLLRADQANTLAHIARHPYPGTNYYAQPNPGRSGGVYTPNEKPYPEMSLPGRNYRLLCLFRFWNVIQYFYPYKYVTGKSWHQVLIELIPEFMRAGTVVSYHKALSRLASVLNDGHAGLWPQVYVSLMGQYNAPFNFRLLDNKAIITNVPDSMKINDRFIRPGNVIETINGVSLKEKMREYRDYVSGSNEGGKLKSLHSLVFRSKDSIASLGGYQPGGSPFTTVVKLKERNFLGEYLEFFEMTSPVIFRMLEDSIGYVFFSNIDGRNIDSVMASLMHAKAIIFDMRNYPANGYGMYGVPGYLLDKPALYARNTQPDFRLPGMMHYVNSNEGTPYDSVGKENPSAYRGKIILLVDERTQSAGEWACMSLQTSSRVTIIGSQTAGADGDVTYMTLLGGYNLFFSGLGIYYPDGRQTQRVGIKVDIPVQYTLADVINKEDPVLKRALKFIRFGQ